MKYYIYSVSQINKYIKNIFEKDIFLNDVFIEAEISNFKAHNLGHFFFTLKDEFASINAIMYKSFAEKLPFLPENGMRVTVYGYISIYEKTGQYQFYTQIIEPTGKGALYAAFEQLKKRLEKEGLFNNTNKKELPKFPKKIAVLTSPSGAAVRDIIKISGRRNPNVKIIVVPILVQGKSAPESICSAIALINKYNNKNNNIDAAILGRGGGSMEDLWCFNDEKVARSIYKSKIPIVSAVGHETDFTIADFVSDLRASTPSAAAEILIPCLEDIKDDIFSLYNDLNYYFDFKKNEHIKRLDNIINSSFFKEPFEKVYKVKNQIKSYFMDIENAIINKKQINNATLENIVAHLEAVSPINVVKRGFSIVYKDKISINSISSVSENDVIDIKLSDGYLKSKVIEKFY